MKKNRQQEKGEDKKPIEDASGRPKKKNKNPVMSEEKLEKPFSTGNESSNEIDESATGKKCSSNEIDEIFSAMKKKKQELEKGKDKQPIEDASGRPKKIHKKKKSKEDANEFVEPSASSRSKKRTREGFTIYTEEELGLGKADAGVCGNGATIFFLIFSILAGIVSVASMLAVTSHIRAWRNDSRLTAAGSPSLIVCSAASPV